MHRQTVVEKAKDFAIEKHGGQMYRGKPYSYHLGEVAKFCKPQYIQTKPPINHTEWRNESERLNDQ